MERVRKICLILIAIFSAINVFDYFSTIYILSHGGYELNPAMKWFMDLVGVHEAMAITKISVISFLVLLVFLIEKIEHARVYITVLKSANLVYFAIMYLVNFQALKV